MKINLIRTQDAEYGIDLQGILSIELIKTNGTIIRILPQDESIKIMKVMSPTADQLVILPLSSNTMEIK